MAGKSVILAGFRHTVESPRRHYPEAELWMQSTSIRNWDWSIYDWSRWFDIHTVGPQAHYPGIQIQRPDVLEWYAKQGPERPIYLIERHPMVPASVSYLRDDVKAALPESVGRYGCQLDYMAATATCERFDRWILYGVGQPYVSEPDSKRAQTWMRVHGQFLWWLHVAQSRGVDVVFDGPNMFHPDVRGSEDPPAPLDGDYGYDMQSNQDFAHLKHEAREGY